MKKLRLSRLTLENFKGVDRLEVNLNGANATISGRNGAGKTTVADAYAWLMTSKMSDGRMAEIGYYDSTGALDTEANRVVEAEFTDGTKFRRESNGSAKFYVSDVPVKASEYISAVRSATNGTINFLATPQAFCSMRWQDRRWILMSLVDITDAEVIASVKELEDLKPLLAKQSVEGIGAASKDQRKKLNVELMTIPARIEELQRTIPTEGSASADDIKVQIEALESQITAKSTQIRELQGTAAKALEPFTEINRKRQEAMRIDNVVTKTAQQIERNETALGNLREDWRRINEAMSGKCPTCGAKVASGRLPEFQSRLDALTAEGKKLAANQAKLKSSLEQSTAEAKNLRKQVDELQSKFDSAAEDPVHAKLETALLDREEMQNRLNKLKVELGRIEASARSTARIAELRERETELGGLIAELDKRIYLAELFAQQKIRLTEGAINSKFEYVRWRMFEPYKSTDGVKECCEPMINGVPYGGNLSKGEKLKAALDILRALQKAFEVELPVFIDDAECYTSNSSVDLPNQVIRLVVAEGVKKLKIDIDGAEKSGTQPRQSGEINLFEEVPA